MISLEAQGDRAILSGWKRERERLRGRVPGAKSLLLMLYSSNFCEFLTDLGKIRDLQC